MIVRTRKRKKYLVNTALGAFSTPSGSQNFCEFGDIRSARRYFKHHPDRSQIDVMGDSWPRCLYYKEGRNIYLNKRRL